MKTVLFACGIAVATAAATSASAQIVGLLGGRSFSHTSTSSDGTGGAVVGQRADLTGGAFVQLPIVPDIMAELEATFVTKGDGGNGANFTLRYAELPVLLHIAPEISTDHATVRPFLSAGPSVAFLLSCSVPISNLSCRDPVFATRSIEVAMIGGGGVEWWTPERSSIGIEARFERSINNTGPSAEGKRVNNTVEFLARLGGIF